MVHQVLNHIVEGQLQRKVGITSCLSTDKCRRTANPIIKIGR